MKIVNFKNYDCDVTVLTEIFGSRNWTYVGRGGMGTFGLYGSALANPYKREKGDKPGSTLPLYRWWLWNKIKQNDRRVMYELRQLSNDSVLVCWCDCEHTCHASVIRDAWQWCVRNNKL